MMSLLMQVFVYSALILYMAGAVLFFKGASPAFLVAVGGCILNLLALIIRTIISGRLPLSSGYEFILSFAFLTVVLYLVLELKGKLKNAGGVIMVIAAMLILSVVIIMKGKFAEVGPLMPALKSPWLTIHVLTAALAYSAFALAAGLAVMQLLKTGLSVKEDTVYRIVAVGFVMLSLSIILGAIWAEQAWGAYWSWDPKEVWALVTWIIYVIYLHLHKNQDWRGQNASIIVIAGFMLVLFTFFGVNYLLSGLHSYAAIMEAVTVA